MSKEQIIYGNERWFSLLDFEGEQWRTIEGFGGIYSVSNYGRVKSSANHHNHILKCSFGGQSKGYLWVHFWHKGRCKIAAVHRLVAEYFIRKPNSGEVINHKDENPHNNHASNLEWCSQAYNNSYGGRMKRIADSLSRAVIGRDIRTGNFVFFPSMANASKAGFTKSAVCRCCKKEKPQYKGYEWSYA